jgi:hypothetical protein
MSALYTVVIDGVPIQCDSPEAAIALARAHGAQGEPRPDGGKRQTHHHDHPPTNTRWTARRVADFYKLLEGKGNQTKLLNALLDTEDSRTDAQLLQMLGLGSGMELAGVFAGLYKNAKKVGADPRELYDKKQVTIGDKRGFEYTLHPGFRAAAAGRGRPA